tara:strand:- start:791 stop:1450 length:660 start_codon:yes stop_codon:yes gene_type:complete
MFQLPNSWNLNNRINENKKESFESWADSTRYLSEQSRADNVVRVLSFPEVSPSGNVDMIKEFDYTHNLVTNDGEIYYAKQGAGETQASNEDFGGKGSGTGYFEMGTTAYTEAETDTFTNFDVGGSSKISGSRQTFTSGYPKTNDTGDSDNTGDATDAVSYAVNYSASAWNDANVEQGCIHDNTSPVSATKLLSVFSFTSFAKTSSDTLKVFVNHAFENQ